MAGLWSVRCCVGAALLTVALGCSGTEPDLGRLVLAISEAPADVQCVRITVEGTRTVHRDVDVVPGESTRFTLGGLPVGMVLVSGQAFELPCVASGPEAVPGWVAEPVAATLEARSAPVIGLRMLRNGRAEIDVSFEDEPVCLELGAACVVGSECCSGACDGAGLCAMPSGCAPESQCGGACVDLATDPSNCGACGLVCDFPNASSFCDAAFCNFQCQEGASDLDGNPENGCEYLCTPTGLDDSVCNGVDDDCDGQVDEGSGGSPCATGLPGACSEGVTSCNQGMLSCLQTVAPEVEFCGDAVDNDCDDTIDEGC